MCSADHMALAVGLGHLLALSFMIKYTHPANSMIIFMTQTHYRCLGGVGYNCGI